MLGTLPFLRRCSPSLSLLPLPVRNVALWNSSMRTYWLLTFLFSPLPPPWLAVSSIIGQGSALPLIGAPVRSRRLALPLRTFGDAFTTPRCLHGLKRLFINFSLMPFLWVVASITLPLINSPAISALVSPSIVIFIRVRITKPLKSAHSYAKRGVQSSLPTSPAKVYTPRTLPDAKMRY